MKLFLCVLITNLFFVLNLSASQYKVSVLANFGEARAIEEWQPTIEYLNKQIPQHHFTLVPIKFKDINTCKK